MGRRGRAGAVADTGAGGPADDIDKALQYATPNGAGELPILVVRARLGRVHEADAGFLAQMVHPKPGALPFIWRAPAGSESVDSVRVARDQREIVVYDQRATLVIGVVWVRERGMQDHFASRV